MRLASLAHHHAQAHNESGCAGQPELGRFRHLGPHAAAHVLGRAQGRSKLPLTDFPNGLLRLERLGWEAGIPRAHREKRQ